MEVAELWNEAEAHGLGGLAVGLDGLADFSITDPNSPTFRPPHATAMHHPPAPMEMNGMNGDGDAAADSGAVAHEVAADGQAASGLAPPGLVVPGLGGVHGEKITGGTLPSFPNGLAEDLLDADGLERLLFQNGNGGLPGFPNGVPGSLGSGTRGIPTGVSTGVSSEV